MIAPVCEAPTCGAVSKLARSRRVRCGIACRLRQCSAQSCSMAAAKVCRAANGLVAAKHYPRHAFRRAYRVAVVQVVGKRLHIEGDQIGEIARSDRSTLG